MAKRVSAVDLFCGAGGLTCGLESTGISVEAGVDHDEACQFPYETNNEAEFYQYDLKEVAQGAPEDIAKLFDEDAEFKLLAGCPPCQPFSTLTNGERSEDYESYALLDAFKDIVAHVEPDYVVMENVHGVYRAPIYQSFEQDMREWGYNLNFESDRSVYCPEFGIPQKRKRWVTLAAKEQIPDIGSGKISRERDYVTVEEAIGHLDPIEAGQTHEDDELHTARELSDTNIERIKHSEPGGTWRDWPEELRLDCHTKESGKSFNSVYGRMRPDEPSPTITTQFYNLGSGRFGHYDTDQDRALSLREGALLQTFPGDYEFCNQVDDVGIRKLGVLIGNAVPPHLGEAIGERIVELVGGQGQTMLADFEA